MTKYHVNPANGTIGICTAEKIGCPLGSDAPHGNSISDAAKAYEQFVEANQDGETSKFPSLKKPANIPEESYKNSIEYQQRVQDLERAELGLAKTSLSTQEKVVYTNSKLLAEKAIQEMELGVRKPRSLDLKVSDEDALLGVRREVDDFGSSDGSGKITYKLPNGDYHRTDGPAVTSVGGHNEYFINGKRLENLEKYLEVAPESRFTRRHKKSAEELFTAKLKHSELRNDPEATVEAKRKAVKSIEFNVISRRDLLGKDADPKAEDALAYDLAKVETWKAEYDLEEVRSTALGRLGFSRSAKAKLEEAKKHEDEAFKKWRQTEYLMGNPSSMRGM